jgi:hypothetical protein
VQILLGLLESDPLIRSRAIFAHASSVHRNQCSSLP